MAECTILHLSDKTHFNLFIHSINGSGDICCWSLKCLMFGPCIFVILSACKINISAVFHCSYTEFGFGIAFAVSAQTNATWCSWWRETAKDFDWQRVHLIVEMASNWIKQHDSRSYFHYNEFYLYRVFSIQSTNLCFSKDGALSWFWANTCWHPCANYLRFQ